LGARATPSVMFLERRFMLMRMRPSDAGDVGRTYRSRWRGSTSHLRRQSRSVFLEA
jgi:hypothetical protein